MLVDLTLVPDDFLHGSPCNPHGCPTFLALKRLLLPGLKLVVQPENALIWDAINPVMHTVQFPEELVKVIQQHDDYTTVLLEPETFQLDIPKEVLRDEVIKARPEEENEISEEEFAEAIRAAFKDLAEVGGTGSYNEGLANEVIGWDEPRDTRYGNKKAA